MNEMVTPACVGCGSLLQTTDETLPGYVPQSALLQPESLCRRCFRIRHYGEFTPVSVTESDYQAQVARIFDEPGLVLYVVDVFDLSGSLVPNLVRFILGSEVVVVVNKADLLPRDVHLEEMKEWIHTQVQLTGVQVSDVLFLSGRTKQGLDALTNRIIKETTRPIYVVGMANTGKSTLLNALYEQFEAGKEPYTVSRRPGTTLAMSQLHVTGPEGPLTFVDTPGLVHGTRVIDRLCADCLAEAVPEDRIRPRIYQLNPGQTLFLGGMARLDFEAGARQPVLLYVSNRLPVHRSKLERAEAIWTTHREDILKVPCASCRAAFDKLKPRPVQTKRARERVPEGTIAISGRGRDLVIPGLGWITLSGKPFRGRLWLPTWLEPAYRPRLVGELTKRPYHERSYGSYEGRFS